MKASMMVLSVLFSTVFTLQCNASPSKNLKKSKLIAAVVEYEGYILVFINTRSEWTSAHRLTDSYTEKEQLLVDQITDKLNLCNLEESTFEPCKEGRSVADLKQQLENSGVEVEPSFEQWITQEIQP